MQIEFSDASHFELQLLAFLRHSGFLLIHSQTQLLELVTFLFEFAVLTLQNPLVFFQEFSKVVEFGVLQYLKPAESGSDFAWLRHLLHFLHRLSQQLVLTLNKSIVIFQQQLQLMN